MSQPSHGHNARWRNHFVTSKIQIDRFLGPGVPKCPKIESIPNFIERSDPEGYSGEGILNKVDK